ncbi:AAA family ATPase [Bacillus cereus]|uniref:AAA family ATPase n=1 Tax=Bacillus cereus TaxID=1396 RepID=UPI00192DF7FF|nr:AAA family ATPase [Bacillus cereus]MDA2328238.1 AAA family ATPase [Bacillus cereus]MDA2334036.1 AAA family ATPase [Bacillus cereus]MDA2358399.1 AAA family ATPase [Bacillus cereus]
MFIKTIRIGKYKKLNDFSLEFQQNINKIDDKNFNLSVLIGENGTAKTTILQVIANILSNSNEKEKMLDYSIEYQLNGINYILNTDNISAKLPSKLIISSFTPVERVYMLAKESKYSLCPIIYSEMGISKLKYIIGKYVLENIRNIDKMNGIVEYIGYRSNEYFLEFNHRTTSSETVTLFIRNLFNGKFDDILEGILTNLNSNEDLNNLISEYEYVLEIPENNRSRKKLIDYMEMFKRYSLEEIGRVNTRSRHHSKFSFVDIERVYLEYIYILLKMQIFSKQYAQRRNTNYKNKTQKLVSNRDLFGYFGGLGQFEKDMLLLDKFEKSVFNDVWFEAIDTIDLIPLSFWSSGELSLFLRLFELSDSVVENSVVLIDEPETHLHPKWIRNYIEILKNIIGKVNCHVIIATHAPLIVSDIPKESIIMLKKEGHKIQQSEVYEETIGLEYEEVLKRIFQVDTNRGVVLKNYESKIMESIEKDDLETVVRLYDQLGDSPTKFDLFLKIKKYYTDRKRNE